MSEHIQRGLRVICRKAGPYEGKRGNVVDIISGQVAVEFETSTILEPASAFERVHE